MPALAGLQIFTVLHMILATGDIHMNQERATTVTPIITLGKTRERLTKAHIVGNFLITTHKRILCSYYILEYRISEFQVKLG